MRRFHCLILIPALCSFGILQAQIFGGTPPSVKWKQMEMIPATIIFPPGLDSQVRQVAWLIQGLNRTTLSTIGKREKPVDIVFHNFTTVPNGYVQLAPFRSEFQLTPPQNSFDLGSLPWNQTLAVHEYRHVQQYNNFNVGLSRAFYILFGQEGLALANSLSVPDWFFEGDAVYQETLVSRQGRGRLPLFLTGFEALWVSGKNYSWMKIRNGSYRDFTPNHYPLGYMLVAYGRDVYGADFWAKTAVDAAAFKGLFYPLQKSITRNAGIPYDSFRFRALNYFRQQVPEIAYRANPALYGKSKQHFVADELFPQFIDTQHLVFLKSSYRLPPEFVIQQPADDLTGTRLKFPAIALDDAFSYRNHKIVYAAYEPDLRWGWKDYSVLRVLDLHSKKDKRLKGKTKYFSPDISDDGTLIVAVEMREDGKSFLDLLDAGSGEKKIQLPNPDHLTYTYPKFYGADHLVSAARNEKGQMALIQTHILNGKQTLLTAWSMAPLGYVSVSDRTIYFTRRFEGTDQGFYLKDGQVFSLAADASAGNYQLSSRNDSLVWSSFSSAGYRIQFAEKKSAFNATPVLFPNADTAEKHEVYSLDRPPFQIPNPFPDSSFPVKHYPSFTHPFNFHSWRPYISDPDFTLALVGQNVLNTIQSELYIGYNRNEQYKKAGADLAYGGLFPVVNLGTEYRIDRNGYYNGEKIYWNEWLSYAGLSVPLNFSRGRWVTRLQGGSNLSFHQQFFQGRFKDSIGNTSYLSLDPVIYFSHQLQSGRMQIYPSFAQTLLFQYNRAISNVSGNQFLGSGNFFFPGLTSTHSLVIRGSVQQRDSLNQLRFSNSFPFSRGYSGENFYRMWGFGINYNFPLVYPDWGFASIVYFLRIRANAFYDYTGVPYYATNGPGTESQYRSAGIEIYLDTKWWNQLPLTLGIRYSRLFDADYEGRGPNQWELILPLNILSSGYSSHLSNP